MTLLGPCEVFLGGRKVADAASGEFNETSKSGVIVPSRFGERVIATDATEAWDLATGVIDGFVEDLFALADRERARVRCITRSKVRWHKFGTRGRTWLAIRAERCVGEAFRECDGTWSVIGLGDRNTTGHVRRVDAKRALLAALRKQDEGDVFGEVKARRVAREMGKQ